MKAMLIRSVAGLSLVLLSGIATQLACANDEHSITETEADIQAAFAKLSPGDQQAAAAQRWCPAMPDDRLGAMGTPIKVTIEGKPVFLCCADCKKAVLENPKATLAKVEKLKKVNVALSKLAPADRQIAETQRFCAVQSKSDLGSMGTPLKVMLEGKPVFLCCGGCKKSALANPKATLATVEKLKAAHGHGHEHGDHK
jgi:hypothetical protein